MKSDQYEVKWNEKYERNYFIPVFLSFSPISDLAQYTIFIAEFFYPKLTLQKRKTKIRDMKTVMKKEQNFKDWVSYLHQKVEKNANTDAIQATKIRKEAHYILR